jgi:hypothetical protein
MSYQYHLAKAYQDELLQDARDAQIDEVASPRQRRQISALLADVVAAIACRVDAVRRQASDLPAEPAR